LGQPALKGLVAAFQRTDLMLCAYLALLRQVLLQASLFTTRGSKGLSVFFGVTLNIAAFGKVFCVIVTIVV